MLRLESANQDVEGRPIVAKIEDVGGVKYLRAFGKSPCRVCLLDVILIAIRNYAALD